MIYGIDALGGCRFQPELLKAITPDTVVGLFYKTFDKGPLTGKRLLEALCKFGVKEIPVHLAPFDPTHRYPIGQLMPKIKIWAREVEAIAVRNPSCIILMSAFCEHNHTAKEMAPVIAELQRIAPSCLMLNSIWKGQRVPGIITELHLESSKTLPRKPEGEYTISFDGFGGNGKGDFPDTDVQAILAKYSDARHIRAWNFRFNGKYGDKDKTPINSRKFWPSVEYIKGTLEIMRAREGEITFQKDKLYKPFADDHGEGGKDNKATLIINSKASSVEVLDSKGNVIDVMKRFGDPHTGTPKGNRYYSSKYAYQLASKARSKTGSSLGRFRAPGMLTPYTDLGLRSNLFR